MGAGRNTDVCRSRCYWNACYKYPVIDITITITVGTLIPIMGILYLVPVVFPELLETLWRVMRTDLDLVLI